MATAADSCEFERLMSEAMLRCNTETNRHILQLHLSAHRQNFRRVVACQCNPRIIITSSSTTQTAQNHSGDLIHRQNHALRYGIVHMTSTILPPESDLSSKAEPKPPTQTRVLAKRTKSLLPVTSLLLLHVTSGLHCTDISH